MFINDVDPFSNDVDISHEFFLKFLNGFFILFDGHFIKIVTNYLNLPAFFLNEFLKF